MELGDIYNRRCQRDDFVVSIRLNFVILTFHKVEVGKVQIF